MQHELTRLEELFYLEVGSAYALSLEAFARKAMDHYAQNIRRGINVFKFDSLGVTDSLTLTVSSNVAPYIAAVSIRQASPSLDAVLQALHGDLEVDYSGIDAIVPAGLRYWRSRGGKLAKLAIPKDSRYRSVRQHIISLGQTLTELVAQGESLTVKDSQYEDSDPTKRLVHTRCVIRRTSPGFFFEYSVRTADLDPVPERSLREAETLFALAAPFFERLSVYKARVTPFRGPDERAD